MERILTGMSFLVPYLEGFRFSQKTGISSVRSPLVKLLEDYGAKVISLRVGRIVPLPVDLNILKLISEEDWLIFSSANGVHAFAWNLAQSGLSSPRCKIAAVGKKTARALESFGLHADLIPDTETGAALGTALSAIPDLRRMLWFAAEKTGPDLEANLRTSGEFIKLPCYHNIEEFDPIDEEMLTRILHCNSVIFTSASAVERVCKTLNDRFPPLTFSIGPACTKTLRAHGAVQILEAETPSYESLLSLAAAQSKSYGGNHGIDTQKPLYPASR